MIWVRNMQNGSMNWLIVAEITGFEDAFFFLEKKLGLKKICGRQKVLPPNLLEKLFQFEEKLK